LLISILVSAVVGGVAYGGSWDKTIDNCYVSVTNTDNSAFALQGSLDKVYIAAPSAWTGTVAVATLYETLFTSASASGTNIYQPRDASFHNTGGATLAATNWYERPYFHDRITLTVVSTSTNQTTDVKVKLYYIAE